MGDKIGSLTLSQPAQLQFINKIRAGDGSQLEPGTLELLAKAGKLSEINLWEPALKLIHPCKLNSMFSDFADRGGYSSELARLARLLWKHENAATKKTYGTISDIFFKLMYTEGNTGGEGR